MHHYQNLALLNQKRLLFNDLLTHSICFHHFCRWQANGRWAELHRVPIGRDRRQFASS